MLYFNSTNGLYHLYGSNQLRNVRGICPSMLCVYAAPLDMLTDHPTEAKHTCG